MCTQAHAIMLLLSTNGARQSHRESINTAPNSAAVGAHTSECYASSLPPVGKSIVYKHGLSRPSTPSPSSPLQVLQSERKPTPPINKRTQAELPFARKASLARFLEKRKDRVQASSAPEADNENAGDAIKKIKTSE
ncbi:hypothetical protein KP509_07G035700 [Ceratopteris richardii]|uniref:Uncharacterized protein n=1 Tax=Ceratopteris richardii TaxID=49495 RepID=A0A8T2U8X0_CERRI|nr:hypothetical protein KP509_07G035700 [Ceratopteris richardii]